MKAIAKGRFLATQHIWFEQFTALPKKVGDVCMIHANNVELAGADNRKQLSLISDLHMDPEEYKLTKTTKNEINRSKREGVEVKHFTSAELRENRELLEQFNRTYHEMYEAKGMPDLWLNMREIEGYLSADAFLLSVAFVVGEAAVYHSYVCDAENARLLHSCSNFRVTEKEVRNAIGRANKYLHWQDIYYLREHGVGCYDWGGVTSFDEPNGIDQFKMSFGGTPVEYYNVIANRSLKAKLAKTLLKLKNRA